MSYHIAMAIAAVRPKHDAFPQSHGAEPTRTLPMPVAVATPIDAVSDAQARDAHTSSDDDPASQPDAPAPPAQHFQRGLGSYPLRSSALL
eukprot:5146192-Pleurochrysis_carterae.AAC.1